MMERGLRQRLGRFNISGEVVCLMMADGPGGQTWDMLQPFLSRVFILSADRKMCRDDVQYIGMSDLFDEIEECETIPEYEVTFDTVEDPESGSHKYELKAVRRAQRCSACGQELTEKPPASCVTG